MLLSYSTTRTSLRPVSPAFDLKMKIKREKYKKRIKGKTKNPISSVKLKTITRKTTSETKPNESDFELREKSVKKMKLC